MCLIIFGLKEDPAHKLILAANRDEFFARPTKPAGWWEDDGSVLAGRDLRSMGTWLGLHKNGKFIAITNYRDTLNERKEARSRGALSKRFLSGDQTVDQFVEELSAERDEYNRFNLLLSDDCFETMYHYSNVNNKKTSIQPGIHGLSNHLLDTPWPKVESGRKAMKRHIDSGTEKDDQIIEFLQETEEAPDTELPNTGISYELEKKLSPVFISMKGYGTRCSTIVRVNYENEVSFSEIMYDENKTPVDSKTYQFIYGK